VGGGFALLCAPRGEFAAASVNYGEVPKDTAGRLTGACPIVGSYGARRAVTRVVEARLEDRSRDHARA
jgi:carboxymethylenebutenolidase